MFRFENEYILYGLFLLPVFVGLYIYTSWRQKKAFIAFGDFQLLKGLMPAVSKRMKMLKFIIICLIYTCLIFTLANPQLGVGIEKEKRKGIDIMFCLDVSNSMLAEDYAPNRLESAKRALMSYIDILSGDRIGLVIFAGNSFVQLPITSDYAAAKIFIANVDTRSISEQGTDIAAAIDMAAASMLTRQEKPTASKNFQANKVIVVISDGEDHATDAIDMAKSASKHGIKTYTIGIGSVSGEPIPIRTYGGEKQFKKDKDNNTVITRLNEKMLKDIADAGNGIYVHATNANVGFDVLHKELEKIEKTEIEDVVFNKYNSKYAIPLWIALFLMVVEVLLYNKKIIKLSHFSWLNKNITGVCFLVFLSANTLMGQTRDELKYLRQGNFYYSQGEKLEKEALQLQQKPGMLNQEEILDKNRQAQQKYEEASTNYLKSNASNTDYYKSLFNLGTSLYKQEKYEDAAKSFEKVAQMNSIDKKSKTKAYHNLGNSLLQQKKYQESIDAYKNALKLDASDMETKYNLEYAKRMLAVQQQQQNQKKDDQKKDDKEKQDQKKDDQQQQNQNKDKQDQNKEQQKQERQEQEKAKKDAERQLDALQQNERRTQEKVKEAEMQKTRKTKQEKDW